MGQDHFIVAILADTIYIYHQLEGNRDQVHRVMIWNIKLTACRLSHLGWDKNTLMN